MSFIKSTNFVEKLLIRLKWRGASDQPPKQIIKAHFIQHAYPSNMKQKKIFTVQNFGNCQSKIEKKNLCPDALEQINCANNVPCCYVMMSVVIVTDVFLISDCWLI